MYKIKNIGKTKTILYNGKNGSSKKNDIEWTVNYDNKNGADINIDMDNNGDRSHYRQYLTNSELEQLLKMPIVNKPIEQRLLEDFNPYQHENIDNYQPYQPYQPYQSYQPPEINEYPYLMNNSYAMSNPSSKKMKPKVIKIRIYTKKHRKSHRKSASSSSSINHTTSRRSRRSHRRRSDSRARK